MNELEAVSEAVDLIKQKIDGEEQYLAFSLSDEEYGVERLCVDDLKPDLELGRLTNTGCMASWVSSHGSMMALLNIDSLLSIEALG
tara:strand:+ start:1016 stop:1273 length:258 start_codon:yes stop_codon:yes gene_type:complete